MPRVNFSSVFTQNPDGSIEPKQRIRIGGVTLSPGVKFSKGVLIAGFDFHNFIKRDFEVETDGDVLVIKAVYGSGQN